MKKANLPSAVTATAVILICIAVFFGIFAIIFGSLKSHPTYRLGMDLVKNDPAVSELFGSPVKDGFFVIGKTQEFRYGGDVANLETSISGPKAHGKVFIFGTETEDGAWWIQSITIRVDGKIVLTYNGSEPDKGFQPAQ
jgi:hypothetical protein